MNRRRRYFHSLFQSVPLDEQVIEVYRCALQKDILVQGHLYVSEHHVCFKANIFGWVTNMVLSFADIVAIEKRKTVKMIPNAIEIRQRNNQKQLFTSFLSRDQAFSVMHDLWWKHRCYHPRERHCDDSTNLRVQRQQAAQLPPDKQVENKDDYAWVVLILVIALLVSDISIAYRITHISDHLMQL
ncbi:GRAM domain-containing protein [Fennellomyces sp. T-0311]|nr:GRAM domain-containing protein [Fennellomyces sp. T-0311]